MLCDDLPCQVVMIPQPTQTLHASHLHRGQRRPPSRQQATLLAGRKVPLKERQKYWPRVAKCRLPFVTHRMG